jgi:uncharacterized protein (DUF305 family)
MVLVAVLTLGTGCAAGPPAAGPPAATGAASSDFGGTDIAWVQLMIPMDEQLLPVLDLVRQRSTDPALVRLATELRSRYTSEIEQLRRLRAQAGLDDSNPHAGHKMPGLIDADTLTEIGGTAGSEFERRVAECLRTHLDQLASLARSEVANGTNAAVKDLARQVEASRTADLAELPAPASGAAGGG